MRLELDTVQNLLPVNYVTREREREISSVLNTDEVIVIYGARQVGKSSLVLNLAKQLISKGSSVHYFTLDEIENADFQSPERLISLLQPDLDSGSRVYLIIDEAQRLENIGLFVKTIYDRKLPLKIILTGSASFSIKSKIQEPLTGRKFEFHLGPFSITEILDYEGINPASISSTNSKLEAILKHFLVFGGYPKVFFSDSTELKTRRLVEIADTYITKDLVELFQITDTVAVRKVTAYIAENIGNLLSIDKITSLGGLKRDLVEKIIHALENIFVSYSLSPLSSDKFKEVAKRPKIYFHDTGLRNAFLRRLDENLLINDLGSLFENTIGNQLVSRYGAEKVNYWRTINQTEVDFVVNREPRLLAIETKYSWDNNSKPRSLLSLESEYSAEGLVLTKDNYWGYLL